MEAGRVGAMIINDVNPAIIISTQKLCRCLKKVKVSVALSYKQDETAELCKFIAPVHHFLESWGDAEPYTGFVSMMQPTISPLFSTRQFQDSLLKWAGNASTLRNLFQQLLD